MPTANQPHRGARFEGYYTKFHLASGSKLIVIMCYVPKAPRPNKRFNITIVHCPKKGSIWQQELWPHEAHIHTKRSSNHEEDDWNVRFDSEHNQLLAALGTDNLDLLSDADSPNLDLFEESTNIGHGSMSYFVQHANLAIRARTAGTVSWRGIQKSTPEGWLAMLPLPLHWHVHSLASRVAISLSLPPEANLADADRDCVAIAHEEKNWANGFPSAHMWVQARETTRETSPGREPTNQAILRHGRGICLAGGRTMGMDAYLIGYRNDDKGISVDFRPPFALGILGFAPFMTVTRNWEERSFTIIVQDWKQKLIVKAQAPASSFFTLSAPTPQGFKTDSMAQSMEATVNVELLQRNMLGLGWTSVCTDEFKSASLEFGGDYFPGNGTHLKSD